MWNRKELKARGKAAFRANYWPSVLAALILTVLTTGVSAASGASSANATSDQTGGLTELLETTPIWVILLVFAIAIGMAILFSIVATLIVALLLNPLEVGCQRFFLVNSNGSARLGELGYGYKANYLNMVKTILLRDVFIWLWSLLFVIPGFIKLYSYRLVPFILSENPDIGSREAITLSKEMMDGHKWNAFILDLSFLGWDILACLSLGLVGLFYVGPYKCATDAELYKAIRDLSVKQAF